MRNISIVSNSQSVASPIRAMLSLSPSHAACIEASVAGLPGDWALDRHESYDGHLTLLIAPGDAHGMPGHPTYVVDRDAGGLHLTAFHDDWTDRLGSFATPGDLVSELHQAIIGQARRAA